MDVPFCYIDALPDHLLVQIFDSLVNLPYLSRLPRERILLNRVGLVCRRWNELAFSPQLWRRFAKDFIQPNQFSPEFSSFFERIAPAVENLQLHFKTDLFPNFFSQLPRLPKVTRLRVFPSPKTTADVDLMVKFCPNVTSASFWGPHLSDEILQILATGWKDLVEVDISGCREVTGAGLIQFVSVANRLQSININNIPSLTDSDIDAITKVLGMSLKSISFGLYQENLSGSAIWWISRNCPQLEEICIQKPMYIGYLREFSNLRKLTINMMLVTIDTFRIIKDSDAIGFSDCFCRSFAHLRSLKIMQRADLSNSIILSDSIVNLIANSCPSLKTFGLFSAGDNRAVTDAGLSEIFTKCRSLTSLSLFGFPSLTGLSFVGGRETLPNLRVLHLGTDYGSRGSKNLDVDVLKTEFAGVKGLKVYRNDLKILNS